MQCSSEQQLSQKLPGGIWREPVTKMVVPADYGMKRIIDEGYHRRMATVEKTTEVDEIMWQI